MNDDPRQADPDAIVEDFNKRFTFIRLADKLSYRDESHEFDAGLFWFHRNMEERGFFSEDFREGITAFYSDNYGLNLNFVTHDELFGQRNLFTIGTSPQLEREVAQNFENLGGERGADDGVEHQHFHQRPALSREPALPDRQTIADYRHPAHLRATALRR